MTKQLPTYNISIYIGSHEYYDGPPFDIIRVFAAIRDFQSSNEANVVCLRVTPCCYIVKDYAEEGYEIAVLNYARFPKPTTELLALMLRLGQYLLETLKQNRVSVVAPESTFLLESPNAREHPQRK